MPPVRFNAPASVISPVTLRLPPETVTEPLALMLLTVSPPSECVTTAPLFKAGITTSSSGPGNADVLQLLVLDQLPPLGLFQVIVDSIARSSSVSNRVTRAVAFAFVLRRPRF